MILSGIKPDPPRRVLGADCSTNSLAWSVFDDGKLVRWGVIEFGKGDLWQRLGRAQKVVAASVDIIGPLDAIYYEASAYVQNKQTVIYLSEALGAALAPLVQEGTKVEPVTAMEWQNAIGNKTLTKAEKQAVMNEHPDRTKTWYSAEYRRIRKQRTIEWVESNFRVKTENDDLADAIGIGAYGAGVV